MDKELDVLKLMKLGRQVKLLAQVMLNQRQKLLMKFQRKYIVESSSSSEESDYDAKYDTVRRMDSSNPLIRLATYGKLKRIVSSYKNHPLDTTDRRILRGLFRKRLKDFDEEHEQSWQKMALYRRLRRGLAMTENFDSSPRLMFNPKNPAEP
jgi:hypothetical protein